MRTMRRHQTLLLIIVALELLALGGVVAWALTHSAASPPKTQPTSDQASINIHTSLKPIHIAPVLVAKGLEAITGITATNTAADKRLFVLEQSGVIKIIDQNGTIEAKPFLDITSKVLFEGEMGLLGMDFHPQYGQNGYFYVHYVNKQKQSVLARYQLDAATGQTKVGSEKVLLSLQQTFTNHKGGQVQFGPDGYLYLGLGDGGGSGDPNNQGQNKAVWFGKILRLDVDHGNPYSIPASNPFAKESGTKPEIWAYGLRNPWRFSFDRENGNMYIADVGQNNYEEINLQSASSKGGENYGWRCYEGFHTFNTASCKSADSYVKPLLEYAHTNGRCSITGGYVYRGSGEPALVGKYFYGDYCSGEIFYAAQQNGAWQETLATTTGSLTTFGEDSAGELYFADQKKGELYRIADSAN